MQQLQAQNPPALNIEYDAQEGVILSWDDTGMPEALFTVECIDSLDPGNWRECDSESGWPISNNRFVDKSFQQTSTRYYRLRIEFSAGVSRGRLIEATQLASLSQTQLNFLISIAGLEGFQAVNGVDVYRILYETVASDGTTSVTASGAVALPQNEDEPVPLISYQHGTTTLNDAVPSNFSFDNLESMAPVLVAADGYAAVAADYLGLGESAGFHPYLAVEPTVTASVDMLRAGLQFLEQQERVHNGQLFLAGYSQGGHATMALHRALEAGAISNLTVTASTPMAGPYDLSGTMTNLILANEPYPSPSFVAYLILGFNEVYDLFESPDEVFAEPYRTDAIPLFDGTHSADEIDAALPPVPRDMFQPEYLEAFENNPDHPLRFALRENDLLDWLPQAPMRMFHCAHDTTVPLQNSQRALESFLNLGATSVELEDPDPTADHNDCIIPSVAAAKAWFDATFR